MTGAVPSTALDLGDPLAVADLRVFLARAKAVEDSGVRLLAAGEVLAVTVGVLHARTLGEAVPTVLGMRTVALAAPAHADAVVSIAAVEDRLARLGDTGTVLGIPPSAVRAPWAAVSPPRGPWTPEGPVGAELLEQAAAAGMAEVAAAVPQQPGAAVVKGARAAVWSRELEGAPGLAAGAAFAAVALGFVRPGEAVQRYTCGSWTRLSSSAGHVLCRRAAVLAG
ncbi:hypothetical protein [Sinomonas halotolerans]|uniref:Uncharacterized protein n=1 Tax=Sinomonas halotolerans TaxID=1644133 RepID=A0ABU9WZV6_9MICC